MKRIGLLLTMMLIMVGAEAQRMGTILYGETIYPKVDLPPEAAPWADRIPDKIESNKYLHFSAEEASYSKGPEIENPELDNSRMARFFKSRNEEISYTNLKEKSVLLQRAIFGKDFIISDTIKKMKWRVVASEQRTILGYTCLKAIHEDTLGSTEVWFTPMIPVSIGPETYGGLPGAILAVNQFDKKIILAKEVILGDPIAPILKPNKGDIVTRKKFDEIQAEKLKEQQSMGRGGGGRMFMFRN